MEAINQFVILRSRKKLHKQIIETRLQHKLSKLVPEKEADESK